MIDQSLVLYILLGLVAALVGWIIYVEVRLARFFAGKSAKSLESVMADCIKELGEMREYSQTAHNHRQHLEKKLNAALRRVSLARFNAFSNAGGNQSFAVALLSDSGDGVIISSLYVHGATNIYAKPISGFKASHTLTAEEQQVLDESRQAK